MILPVIRVRAAISNRRTSSSSDRSLKGIASDSDFLATGLKRGSSEPCFGGDESGLMRQFGVGAPGGLRAIMSCENVPRSEWDILGRVGTVRDKFAPCGESD
jgi:hypothetical protein